MAHIYATKTKDGLNGRDGQCMLERRSRKEIGENGRMPTAEKIPGEES